MDLALSPHAAPPGARPPRCSGGGQHSAPACSVENPKTVQGKVPISLRFSYRRRVIKFVGSYQPQGSKMEGLVTYLHPKVNLVT